MENIADLTVTQIRIFPVDVIPLSILTTKSCIDKVREGLSIVEVQAHPFVEGKDILIFRKGELKTENRIVAVNGIQVEPRRIILEVAGTSKEASQVYEALLSIINTVSDLNSKDLHQPLLLVESTRCVVTLGFNFDAIFSNQFIEFLNSKVRKEATSKIAKGSIKPLTAVAEIAYQLIDKSLRDNDISMNPKQFTITPRAGAPAEARKYAISSPFDSGTHLKLIRELNKAITGIS